MSPVPATPDTALQVPATPAGALRADAVAQAPRVLQEAAISPPETEGRVVAIADLSTVKYAGVYFEQVYHVPATSVRFVNGVAELEAMILSSIPADRLLLLLHSAEGHLLFQDSQETVSLPTLAADLSTAAGRIVQVCFDGCTLGTTPSIVYAFAASLGIREAVAWTHTHAVGRVPWQITPPNATSVSDSVMTQLERMAPWFPMGEYGATESATNLRRLLLKERRFDRAYEVFFVGFRDVNFEELVLNNSFNPTWHYPRGAATEEVSTTLARAMELDDEFAMVGPLKKMVVRPGWLP